MLNHDAGNLRSLSALHGSGSILVAIAKIAGGLALTCAWLSPLLPLVDVSRSGLSGCSFEICLEGAAALRR